MSPPEEPVAVEAGGEVDGLELLHGVAGVLGLDAVVPGEEGDAEVRVPLPLDRHEPVLEVLPEARRGPVLDGETRPLGVLRVLAAVEPPQLVAEVERRRATVLATADVVE